MNIQIIYYGKRKDYGNEYNYDFSPLDNPNLLDMYEINIIDLSSPDLWINKKDNRNYLGAYSELIIDRIRDFDSLKKLLEKSKKAKNIVILPQNFNYIWEYYSIGNILKKSIVLKDLIPAVVNLLKNHLIPNYFTGDWTLLFGNTITECITTEYKAAFSFDKPTTIMTTCKDGSNATTICSRNCIITTLDLQNHIRDFLREIKLDNQKEFVPEWVKDYCFYNDEEQKRIIDDNNQKIKQLEDKNSNSNEQLRINEHYKSILFSSGDCLVSVVFEILEKILSCDLSTFKDEKKEDFLIKKEDITFIGEIKGINSNVKNENVSQLEVHSQCYFDKLNEEDKTESVKALLIINPFRTKPVSERDPVHETQIKLAERYGSLIITSEQILKIFEKFLFGDLKSEQIIARFKKESGLFEL